jgi:hypothetical protein
MSRTLRLDRATVRRYATAATADQLIGGTRLSRPGLLGPHQAYLRQRWDDGCRSTERLHEELRERGYRDALAMIVRLAEFGLAHDEEVDRIESRAVIEQVRTALRRDA